MWQPRKVATWRPRPWGHMACVLLVTSLILVQDLGWWQTTTVAPVLTAQAHRRLDTVHMQYTAHSTQYTVHSTQTTVHSTQHTVHSTQHTVHSTQYTAHSTQYTAEREKIIKNKMFSWCFQRFCVRRKKVFFLQNK